MNVRVPKAGSTPGPVLWMVVVKKGNLKPLFGLRKTHSLTVSLSPTKI